MLFYLKKRICLAFIPLIGLFLTGCSTDETPTFGSIYGIISDSETGEPLRTAEIVLSPGNLSTITGQSGHFEFTDLEAGQYKIQASANGYQTNNRQITVVPGQKASGDISLTEQTFSTKIKLNTSSLNFGTEHSTLSFSIQNVGNAGVVRWNITDIEEWLNVSPMSGETDMGKSSTVVVKINRKLVTSEKSTTIIVMADGESSPIVISAKPSADYTFSVSPSQLSFDSSETIKTLKLCNESYNGALSWNISGDLPGWIKTAPNSGSLRQSESASVTVTINRSLITSKVSTTLYVNAGEKVIPIIISCDYTSTPLMPYTEISPDTPIDFGKTMTSKTISMKSHHASVPYYTRIDGYASWLNLNKPSGMLSDYEISNRAETLTLTVDRTLLYDTSDYCTLVITAGEDTYQLKISISKESSGGGDDGGGDGGETEDYSKAKITSCDSRVAAKIVSCKHSGTSVVFTYTLTNNGLGTVNDWRIYPPSAMSVIQGGTKSVITDNTGTEYAYPTMTFRTASTSGSNVLNTSFPNGMTCQGTVTLKNAPTSATTITAIIGVYAYPNSTFNMADSKVTFKNVPIY